MSFTEFYCDASTGSNLNGGSPIGGSYPFTYTNGGWNSVTGVFTPASGNPQSNGVTVGDFASAYTDGASSPTVFVARVTAVSSTTITLSTTAKSGTAPTTAASGITVKVGGAWKGPNGTENFPFGFITNTLTDSSGDTSRVNFKNGTNYAVTATTTHGNAGPVVFQGYTSSVGDGGQATIDGGTIGASYVLLTLSGGKSVIQDFILQNNGASGSATGLVLSGGNTTAYRCVVNSVRGHGINASSSPTDLVECEAYSCNQSNTANTGGFNLAANNMGVRCISHDNSGNQSNGFTLTGSSTLVDCIADTNGSYGFGITGANMMVVVSCTAYNNAGGGIVAINNANANIIADNCLLVSNGGYGVSNISGASTTINRVTTCAFYGNTSGPTNNINASFIVGSVTLTADPFTAASTGNFTLNSTASAGAACRGTGRGTFTETQASYTGTLGYPDIGAVQHQDSGSGGFGGAIMAQNIMI